MDPTLDGYGLWTLIEEVTSASGFKIGENCGGYLRQLVISGNDRLRDALNNLSDPQAGQPRATLRSLLQSEWGRRWHGELVLLELPVAARAASEILQTEAQLNALRYVGQMMSEARREGITQNGFTVLQESSFFSAERALCPIWPFC